MAQALMVSLGDASKAGINLTSKLSFGGWFSPSAADSTERNVCHKSGQFGLHYHSNTGVVTASITIRQHGRIILVQMQGGYCWCTLVCHGNL